MPKYICVHGHFYQPPRENPWIEEIETQESAAPFHDWNERINVECYAPNAAARVLNEKKLIGRISNNYARISFNFGPTLLGWMVKRAPVTYRAILKADQESRERFSGHGSALAQGYNHIILPLASERDIQTQVVWGRRDFEFHFGRKPEGMWLPETAVDIPTLEALARQGIKFTVLAPHQASRTRRLDQTAWQEAGGKIDPTKPYRLTLPSGKTIALFFYHGPLAHDIAFGGLLERGDLLAQRLLSADSGGPGRPPLIHTATDGETYGHHHRFGEMALTFALDRIEADKAARLTNYGEFLAKFPPQDEVEIAENTSWSCPHGVERWRSNCGCRANRKPGLSQAWRRPLRNSLDWLRDELADLFHGQGKKLFQDPWAARDDYVEVILDRTDKSIQGFLKRHGRGRLKAADRIRCLKLLEMQRHALLMYTSCGWFFDDLADIETVQIIQYAGRTIQLAEELGRSGLEKSFLDRLAEAKSAERVLGDGRLIYRAHVTPAKVDLPKVGAHFAVSSLFQDYPERARVGCYVVRKKDYHIYEAGRARLAAGRLTASSLVTLESMDLQVAVIHFGDHLLSGGVGPDQGEEGFARLLNSLAQARDTADLPAAVRALDQTFGQAIFSLKSLFKDEQRRILESILQSKLLEVEEVYREVHLNHAPLMRYLRQLFLPAPPAFLTAAKFVLNADLRRALEAEDLDLDKVQTLLLTAAEEGVSLDEAHLSYSLRLHLERRASRCLARPEDLGRLKALAAAVGLVTIFPFDVELWKVQNAAYELLKKTYPELKARAGQPGRGRLQAKRWVELFEWVAGKLSLALNG